MKIDHLDILAGVARPAGSRQAADPALHQTWRRALELAQWEGRMRYQGIPAEQAREPDTRGGPEPAAQTAPLAGQAAGEACRQGAQRPANERAESPRGSARGNDVATPVTTERTGAGQTTVGHAQWLRRAQPKAPLPASARVPVDVPGERPHWMPTALVVNVHGQQVRASLRDNQVDAAAARRLYHELRAHLAAQGLELVELMVNGQALRDDPRTASIIGEEKHGG